MDIEDHNMHGTLLYYPSNAFRLGSVEELQFFKSKWSNKSDKRRVQRIYDDFQRIGTCPCRILYAFNVVNAVMYKKTDVTALRICDRELQTITRLAFANEYQLKTTFFTNHADEEIKRHNVSLLRARLPDLFTECEMPDGSVPNRSTKAKKITANRRKLEHLERRREIVMAIAESLSRDAQKFLRVFAILLTTQNKERLLTYYYYCNNILLKRGRLKYLKLDYFNRFGVVLNNTDMYIPKISKNKAFKQKTKALKEKIERDCNDFWGITQQRESLNVTTNSLPSGQLVVMNDNPSHAWYNLASECKHTDGYEFVHSQTRCNDEMITTFKYCKRCYRRVV